MIVEKFTGPETQIFSVRAENPLAFKNWVDIDGVSSGFSIRHDGSSIHLYYQVTESHVRALSTVYNGPVWEDSCVEFFFSPNKEGKEYYNFEFNAIGTVLGGYGPDRNRREHLPESVLKQVETTPSLGREPIEGIYGETTWTLRVRIPLKTLVYSKIEDLSGLDAHANFYKCGDKLDQPHFLSWKPVLNPTPDFHTPRYFGQLSFM